MKKEKIRRREFLRRSMSLGLGVSLGNASLSKIIRRAFFLTDEGSEISVVTGSDYFRNTIKAVEALGGIAKFVPKGAAVAIVPNSQSRHPGTFTKPEIVRAVIRLCKEAGAREINCLSWLSKDFWEATGLVHVIEEEGASLRLINREDSSQFEIIPVHRGKILKEAEIVKELFRHDVFIDLPVVKDHAGNRFTGTMKNLMALNSPRSNRSFHREDWKTNPDSVDYLDQCIADLNTVLEPALCVVDATEFIVTNGPFGPGKIIIPRKIVAGRDRVAIDSYCTTLWGMKGEEILMIRYGFEHGLGEINLKKIKIKQLGG